MYLIKTNLIEVKLLQNNFQNKDTTNYRLKNNIQLKDPLQNRIFNKIKQILCFSNKEHLYTTVLKLDFTIGNNTQQSHNVCMLSAVLSIYNK